MIPYYVRVFDTFSDTYGFRGTMLIVGGLLMNNIPLMILLRQTKMAVTSKRQWHGVNKEMRDVNENNTANDTSSNNTHAHVNLAFDPHVPTINIEPANGKHLRLNCNLEVLNGNGVRANDLYNNGSTESSEIGELSKHSPSMSSMYEKPIEHIQLHVDTFNSINQSVFSNLSIRSNTDSDRETPQQGTEVIIEDTSAPKVEETKPSFKQALRTVSRNFPFFLFAAGQAFGFQAGATLTIFLQDIFLDSGFSTQDATLAILLLNLFSMFGRLLPGLLFEVRCMPTFGVPVVATSIISMSVIAVYYAPSLALKYLALCFAGLAAGMNVTNFGLMTMRFFDVSVMSTGMGVVMTTTGLSVSIFGPLAGKYRSTYR